MRGAERVDEFVTTDLLDVWTDPDTAMEAVGAALGILGARVSDVRRVLTTDSPLRRALYSVLLDLVEGGALEKRACSDGRYAFRWRDDIDAAVFLADIDLTVEPEPETEPESVLEPISAPVTVRVPETESSARPAVALEGWTRVIAPAAPLLFPAISCVLAIVAFVALNRALAVVIAAALTLVGVVGLVRRVPFAGLWIMGVLVAGLVLRVS